MRRKTQPKPSYGITSYLLKAMWIVLESRFRNKWKQVASMLEVSGQDEGTVSRGETTDNHSGMGPNNMFTDNEQLKVGKVTPITVNTSVAVSGISSGDNVWESGYSTQATQGATQSRTA